MELKLPFNLSYRRHKRVKVSKGQLPLFVEQNFDARALLVGLYNFGTCQRSDGSFYGHGGAQCHKGTEATPESMLAATKTGKVSSSAAKLASDATSIQLESLKTNQKELAAAATLFEERCAEQVQRLRDGEVTSKELETAFVGHFDHDISKSEFVFIGMENSLGESNLKKEADSAGQFAIAKVLAIESLVASGEMSLSQATLANNAYTMRGEIEAGKTGGINSYVGAAASIASQASGGPSRLSKTEASVNFFGGTKVSTIEMSVPAAVSVGHGLVNKNGQPTTIKRTGQSSMDPNASVYGAMYNGQAGAANTKFTRNYVSKNLQDQRNVAVAAELKKAAASDKFRGGMAAPGGGVKYTNFKQGVIDTLARGGTPVYTTKVELSTGGKVNPKTGEVSVVKKKTHTLHIAELAPGKHLVSGDFSLNTTGYAANNNQAKAYQAGIKAVQSGTATRYTPPASSSRSNSTSSTRSTTAKSTSSTSTNNAARNEKMELRRRIAKARRDGRDADAAALEASLRKVK